MPDWPTTLAYTPDGVMHPGATGAMTYDYFVVNHATAFAAAVWPAANLAIYIPFMVETTVTAYKMATRVTTQAGNCDVGIYDELANRLVSAGSTAVGAAGLQTFDITDTVLTPGVYYMAMCVSDGTAAFWRVTPVALWQNVLGVRQQAVGAVTLPDPATFANPANNYIPALTVAFKSVI